MLPRDRTGRPRARTSPATYRPRLEGLEDRAVPTLLGNALFPADSPWHQRVDAAPVAANSATLVAAVGAQARLHPDFGSGTYDGSYMGIPYVVVAGTQPKVNVVIDAYADESDVVPVPIPANAVIEGDPKPGALNGGDRHLLVYDKDNNLLYELYRARRPAENADGRWHADGQAVWDLKRNHFRPRDWTSADAAGLPILPGLIRADEVLEQGRIDHAIRFTVPRSRNAYVFPASHHAGANDPSLPRMGERFRLKASFNVSGYSPANQVILRAMKEYGLIVADNGASWYVTGAPDPRWDNDDLHALANVVGANFEAVDLTPRVVGLDVTRGPVAGGTRVTISGLNFSGGAGLTKVLFGTTAATDFLINSDRTITVTAPAGTAGTTVDVRVQSGYGTSAVLTGARYTYVSPATNTPPSLAAVADQTLVSGTTLTLTLGGSDPDGDPLTYTARIVNAAQLATASVTGNQLTLRPAAHQLGTFTVEVTVGDGVASAARQFKVDLRGNWATHLTADVDGDGDDEVLSFNAGDGTWWVNRSTGSAFALQRWAMLGSPGAWTLHVAGDFDGDGRGDAASFNARQGWWHVGTSTGATFVVTPWARNWSGGDVWTTVQAGDFTGDGKADLAAFHVSGQWWVAASTGSSLVSTLWAGNWSGGRVWQFYPGDFDGDGKRDVAAFHVSGEWWVARSTGTTFQTARWANNWSGGDVWRFYVGDYDGDRKDDVAAFHVSGEWWVARSTGGAFATARWAFDWSAGDLWTFLPADYDGDRRADVGAFHRGGEWWLAQSTGAAFQTTRWASGWAPRDLWAAFLAGDFDADGKDDVAALATDGAWWLAHSDGTAFRLERWATYRV